MAKRIYRIDIWASVENADKFDICDILDVMEYDEETRVAWVSDYADSEDDADAHAEAFAEYLERHGVVVAEYGFDIVDIEKIPM